MMYSASNYFLLFII